MDGYVHVDANFVNQKYKPMYPDRTLDKKIEKLCNKVDQLINLNAKQIVEKTFFKQDDEEKKKKYPFWYLVVGVIVCIFLYFKIKSPVYPNAYSGPQQTVGHRPSYG